MKIALCGSARFEEAFHHWNEVLSLMGHVVYSLAVLPSRKGGEKKWYNADQKERLDLVHLAKIEESDAIFVVDMGGPGSVATSYMGDSTLREITWARIRGVDIYFASKWDECRKEDPMFLRLCK